MVGLEIGKVLTPLIVALVSAVGPAACGSGGKSTVSNKVATSSTAGAVSNANHEAPDFDRFGDARYDHDDDQIRYFGHAASRADRQAVMATVERFYTAAAEENGSRACSLLVPAFVKAVVEIFNSPNVDPELHGKTCAAVMFNRFKQLHRQFTYEHATLKITSVRIEGRIAAALLRFDAPPLKFIYVIHEHGEWKLAKFSYPLV